MLKDLLLIILGVAICYTYFFWQDYKNKKEKSRAEKIAERLLYEKQVENSVN